VDVLFAMFNPLKEHGSSASAPAWRGPDGSARQAREARGAMSLSARYQLVPRADQACRALLDAHELAGCCSMRTAAELAGCCSMRTAAELAGRCSMLTPGTRVRVPVLRSLGTASSPRAIQQIRKGLPRSAVRILRAPESHRLVDRLWGRHHAPV